MKNMTLNQTFDQDKLCKIVVAVVNGHGSRTELNSDTYPPETTPPQLELIPRQR